MFRQNILVTHSLYPIEHILAFLHYSRHSSLLPKILEPHPNLIITSQVPLNTSSWYFFHSYPFFQSMFSLLLTFELILFYDANQFLNNFIHLIKFFSIVGTTQGTPISHLSFVQIFHAAQAKGVTAFKIYGVNHQLQADGTCKFLRIKTCLKPTTLQSFVLMSVDQLLLLIFLTQQRSKLILCNTLQPCLVNLLPRCLFRLFNHIVIIPIIITSPALHYNLHFLLFNIQLTGSSMIYKRIIIDLYCSRIAFLINTTEPLLFVSVNGVIVIVGRG